MTFALKFQPSTVEKQSNSKSCLETETPWQQRHTRSEFGCGPRKETNLHTWSSPSKESTKQAISRLIIISWIWTITLSNTIRKIDATKQFVCKSRISIFTIFFTNTACFITGVIFMWINRKTRKIIAETLSGTIKRNKWINFALI